MGFAARAGLDGNLGLLGNKSYFCGMGSLLIVGGGLAGSILALEAHSRGIGFKWAISKSIPSAYSAAYGMCNPVHFKNTLPAFKADVFFPVSVGFFSKWQAELPALFMRKIPVRHLVKTEEEFTYWRQQVESTGLWKYTNGEPVREKIPGIKDGFCGNIEIPDVFFIDIPQFVNSTREFFNDVILWEDYRYKNAEKDLEENVYNKIIFADGTNAGLNPHFNWVPFNPCKGQTLHLKIKDLELKHSIHKKIVLVPLGNEEFICGATYEWDDLTNEITSQGLEELLYYLSEILESDLKPEIIAQKAGVRPTIADRRPVVGSHPALKNLGILNGFGTRGLLVGPHCAAELLDHLYNGKTITPDWDVNRFKKRFLRSLTENR